MNDSMVGFQIVFLVFATWFLVQRCPTLEVLRLLGELECVLHRLEVVETCVCKFKQKAIAFGRC